MALVRRASLPPEPPPSDPAFAAAVVAVVAVLTALADWRRDPGRRSRRRG
ncbi:hypothetical protein [Rhodosalinus sediminis]|nr:hypothetical protein [Rhodosalinus sediminis]